MEIKAMQFMSAVKDRFLAPASKATFLLIPVVVFGLWAAPTVEESAKAVVCDNAPTQPTLNPYPVTFESPAPFCHDFPAIDARLSNGQYSTSQTDLNNGLTAVEGDEIFVLSYIHNGATNVGLPENETTARDVNIRTTVPTSAGTSHTITTNFSGSNTNTVNGSFTVHTPAGMKLEVIPNSGEIFDFTGSQALQSGLNMGNGQAVSIGDLRACFEFSVFVRFKVKVVRDDVPELVNNAVCVSNVVITPNPALPGQAFTGSVRVRNTGTTTWVNPGHFLAAQNTLFSGSRIELPQSIPPNGEVTLPLSGTLPNTSGTFTGGFQMSQAGALFGAICPITVVINPNPPTDTVLQIEKEVRSHPSGSFAKTITVNNGSTVEYRIRIKNVGTTTALNVIATDTFASGLTFVSNSLNVSRNFNGQLTVGGMTFGNLGVNEEIVITYLATVNQTSGVITNTATADADNAAQVQSSANVNVNVVTPVVFCVPDNQTAFVNDTLTFHATGGNGSFSWSAPGGNPSSGTNSSFTTSFNTSGSRTVTVLSGNSSDVCNVTINDRPDDNDLECIPSSQTVDVRETADFQATGGNGSFSWSAPGGNPSSGSGRNFDTFYTSDGTRTVTVFSGNQSDSCTVRVDDDDDDDDDDRELDIDKTVRNLTTGSSSFQNSVNASVGDRVEFRIRVTNSGDGSVSNVRVEDDLPSGLNMRGDFDEEIGTLRENDSETITFQADVTSSASAGTCLVNTAEARGNGVSRVRDSASVCIGSVAGTTVNLNLNKRAWNDTRGADAQSVTANRGDLITYTLTVTNSGNGAQTNFVITDDLSGILPFVDVIDLGGGFLSGQTLSYSAVTVPAGGSVSKTFRVRVKDSLQRNLTFVLRNTYGNTVTINVGAVAGESIFVAPKTGVSGTSAGLFAGLITAGFVAFRKRRSLQKLIWNS